MKILVIFTGGTIGSVVRDGYISPDKGKTYKLLEMYKKVSKRQVEFDVCEPYTILSENLTGEHIRKLGECVRNNLDKSYDGIIITHGTDTIQYSAAALDYHFPCLKIPVMLVSANYVLDNSRSNGLANFWGAIEFIAGKMGVGVFISYKCGEKIVFHKGNRVLAHREYRDNIHSVDSVHYGTCEADGALSKNIWFFENDDEPEEIILDLPKTWNSGIIRIVQNPGLDYEIYNLDKVRGIILDAYHSGTICSEMPGIEEFFWEASKKNIPIFLTGADLKIDYDSVKKWKDIHVVTLGKGSGIAMYMKLWMALESKDILKRMSLEEVMTTRIGKDFIWHIMK